MPKPLILSIQTSKELKSTYSLVPILDSMISNIFLRL